MTKNWVLKNSRIDMVLFRTFPIRDDTKQGITKKKEEIILKSQPESRKTGVFEEEQHAKPCQKLWYVKRSYKHIKSPRICISYNSQSIVVERRPNIIRNPDRLCFSRWSNNIRKKFNNPENEIPSNT